MTKAKTRELTRAEGRELAKVEGRKLTKVEEDTELVLLNEPIQRHLEYVESVLKAANVKICPEHNTAMWLINDLRVFCLHQLRAHPRQYALFKLSKIERQIVSNVAGLHGVDSQLIDVIWAGVGGWLLQLMAQNCLMWTTHKTWRVII